VNHAGWLYLRHGQGCLLCAGKFVRPRALTFYQLYGSQGQGNISTLTGTLPGQRPLQRGVASDIADYGEMWMAYLVDTHASEEEQVEADMGASPRWEASLG
jgi:hypothetical protein